MLLANLRMYTHARKPAACLDVDGGVPGTLPTRCSLPKLIPLSRCILRPNVLYMQQLIGGAKMTTAVRVSEDLVKQAKIYSKIDKRSVTGQIEYWAMIGKCAEENPDLTYSLIKEIFIGLTELEQGEYSEYKFG